jgi:uncharacterized protein (TIGR02001 family)
MRRRRQRARNLPSTSSLKTAALLLTSCAFLLAPVAAGAQTATPGTSAPEPLAEEIEETEEKEAAAEAEDWLPGVVGGHVALTSNYVDRGITQSSNDPAIQGSLEYSVGTGLGNTRAYIGTWSSSVDLEGDRSTANVEIDALFGIRGEVDDFSWDVGGAYFYYPGTRSADNFDYWEIPVVLGYQATDQLALELTNLFSPENQFNTGLANYVVGLAYYDIPVPYVGLQLFGGVGYQYIEDDFNGTDWRLGATVNVKGVEFTVAYTDTDYRARECGNNQCNAKVSFTVGMEF